MLDYDRFYRMYGTRLLRDLVTPKVISASTFEFPRNSVLYHFGVSDVFSYVTKKDYFLQNAKKIVCSPRVEYKGDTIGSFQRVTSVNPNTFISDMARKEKRITFRKIGQGKIGVTDQHLIDMYYGMLNGMHRYSMHPLNRYYKFHNVFTTVITELATGLANEQDLKVSRHRFIVIDLPRELPTRPELDRYAKNMTSAYLKELDNYRYLNVIEFWKFLTPDLKENSVLGKIPTNILDRIDILFTIDGKISVCNLGLLAYLVKEYNYTISREGIENDAVVLTQEDIDAGISVEDFKITQKYSAEVVRKIFYLYLYRVINNIEKKALNTNKQLSKMVVSASGDDEGDIVNIDKVLNDNVLDKEESNIKRASVRTGSLKDEDTGEQDQIDMDYDDAIDFDAVDAKETITNKTHVKEFKDLEELYKDQDDYLTKLDEEIKAMKDSGLMSKKEASNCEETLKTQVHLPSPYSSKVKLKDVLDRSKDNYDLAKGEDDISDTKSVLDKSYNKKTVSVLTKKYLNEQYRKDIVRMVYALQNHGIIIENYDITETENYMGGLETHVIDLKMLTGKKSKISFLLPKVNEDGEIKLSGNNYMLRTLRTELPIRRINPNTVVLNSYYGKEFVKRAVYANGDRGKQFFKHVLHMFQNDPQMTGLTESDIGAEKTNNIGVELPTQYAYIARYVTEFTYGKYKFLFNYPNREELLNPGDKINNIEKPGHILVGKFGKEYLVMGPDDTLYLARGKSYTPHKGILEIVGLKESDLPMEYTTLQIMKDQIPTVILLGYYIGLEQLFRLVNVPYTKHEPNARVQYDPEKEYVVKFKDVKLVIKKTNKYGDLIIAGLLPLQKVLKDIKFSTLNKKEGYAVLFTLLTMKVIVQTEIKILEHLFIDPITLTLLERMKEPTTFKGLLLKANEIMHKEKYTHPNDIAGSVLKGYERIPGLLYNNLVKAVKEYENMTYFSKGKFALNSYCVIKDLQEDSTNVMINDLNPIAYVKLFEDTSFVGKGGRSSDLSMNKETRASHKSEIGLISEGVKDNGSVGVTAYLSGSPNITNTRGTIDTEVPDTELTWAKILSTPGLLMPFSIKDDPKRLNFFGIQSAHTVPMLEMKAPMVRTGYEAILPIKVGGKFVTTAEEEGKVLSVSKTNMVVEYKTKGKKTYRITTWTTKEESGACYTHVMVPNLLPGEKFRKDDTLIYDKHFFEPDIFDQRRVIFKQGTTCNTCLMDIQQTTEDSISISKEMNKRLGCQVTKVLSYVLEQDKEVLSILPVGTKVEPTTALFTIGNATLKGQNVSKDTLRILETIQRSSPKAKVKGTISKIRVIYNAEPKEMSKSLRALTEYSDTELLKESGYTGRVTEAYSVEGKKLMPGSVQIKIYIQLYEGMGIGDKAVLANQLKCTVGEVFENDVTTEDGTKVDAYFSYKAVTARIVNSAYLMGTSTTLLEKIQEKAVEMYFGK